MALESFQSAARVTIKDVSREAGVSVATVSNAINTPEVLAPGTLERVTATIDKLGYRPNRNAIALQKRRTFSIGYRMPSETSGLALDAFLHHMVERAGTSGLDIVLFMPQPGQTEVDAYSDMIRRGAVDGFVLSGTTHKDERIDYLLDVGFPFASFGRTHAADAHSWVDVDGLEGVRLAVEHLTALGHGRIALVRWPEGSMTGDDRANGYLRGLSEAGIGSDDSLVIAVENIIEDASAAVRELLSQSNPPTAIVAVQDTLAVGAMQAVEDLGMRVGLDVAVTGFDDTSIAAHTRPALTSVRQVMESVGNTLVDMLLDLVDPGESDVRSELIRPELIVRPSSDPSVGPKT